MKKQNTPWLLAGLLAALPLSPPVHAAAGDTVADRILGQRRFGTALPYFVDGTLLDAAGFAIDRSAEPNRVYVASPDLNRVLGWSDLGRFRAGAPADLVLGQPSVFNGDDIPSYLGCPAPTATSFCRPTRVAVDPQGNLYVADSWNFRVLELDRPFASDRVADRVFGQRNLTSRRLPAQLSDTPLDIAVDSFGDLWTTDPGGARRILEFDAPPFHDTRADRVIDLAPENACSGGPRQPLPCSPLGLEVSTEGDLYVRDRVNPGGLFRVVVFRRPLTTDLRPDFELAQLQGGTSPPAAGVFDHAGGRFFVAERHVWRYPPPIGPDTQPVIVSPALSVAFAGRPALDARGSLYVASYTDPLPLSESFVYALDAPFQAEVARIGREVKTSRGIAMPNLLAIDRSSSPNHLYVADAYNRVLGWRDAEGFANGAPADLVLVGTSPDTPGSCAGAGAGQFCPHGFFVRGGLAVDSRGNLWLSDVDNHRVLELDRPFESDGVADRVLGQGGSFTSRTCNLGGLSARSLCYPGALAFDREDHLYIADLANHRVLLFEHPLTDDSAAKVFGQTGFAQGRCNQGRSRPDAATLCLGEVEGESNPHFFGASSLAVDARGNLYVADIQNNRVLIYRDPRTSDATADGVIGQDGFQQTLHGTGARRFAFGYLAVAVAPSGELYVDDPGNDRVLELRTPLRDSTADRVFGHAGFTAGGFPYPDYYHSLPPATAANLLQPMGVAVDAEGNLYVADTVYDRVLAYDRP